MENLFSTTILIWFISLRNYYVYTSILECKKNYKVIVYGVFVGLSLVLFFYKVILNYYGYNYNAIPLEFFIALICIEFITGVISIIILIGLIVECIEQLKNIMRWFHDQSDEYKANLLELQKLPNYIETNHRRIYFNKEKNEQIKNIFKFFLT